MIQQDVFACPRAARAVTVNKCIDRDERDSLNQVLLHCSSLDRFVASVAIIAFSGVFRCRSSAAPRQPRHGCDLVDSSEA
jgi:hypothetical protein